MSLARRIVLLTLALVVGGILGSSVAGARHPDRLSCLPITTCDTRATTPDAQRCPDGHSCVCVPSCPVCEDCAAQVCVPVEIACHSACECPDGMGCGSNGYCSNDAEPVFCCDSAECPAGDKCQTPNGEIDICQRECRTACDCEPGLGCFDGQCIAGIAAVYCCEGDVCPIGNQCQHGDGTMDRCRPEPECRTACDCTPGLGCFDGQCIAGFAPVYCCEGDVCTVGNQCQHKNGEMGRCGDRCLDHAWLCNDDSPNRGCTDDRICACTASCPNCEDCGPKACMPPDTPTPYRCNDNGTCAQDGHKCVCLSSCPDCDDCALNVCVPGCDDEMCAKRLRTSERRINRVVEKTRPCRGDNECAPIETSTGCAGHCTEYVNRRYAQRVQNFIDHVDQRYCTGYQEAGCPFSTPSCQETVGACVRGLCTAVSADGPVVNPRPIGAAQPNLPDRRR